MSATTHHDNVHHDTGHTVTTIEQLRTMYRAPSALVANKEQDHLDAATRSFIERCPFVLVATVGGDGTADVSPRGGPSGFIRVLDDTHVAIADLPGNNRLDTLENIVTNGQVGLLFVMPGQGETVRLNGTAHLSTDPAIIAGFTAELKPPKAAIVVSVVGTYIHCAKAMQRSRIWDPTAWAEFADAPDGAEILVCQNLLPDEVTAAMVRNDLHDGYVRALAEERATSADD
jgi:PPOX class probable FMN-dependent enzyme